MSEIDQLSDGIRFPGDVRVDDIILITHAKESISISNIFVELNLYEDLYSNTLSGDITLIDGSNLPMNGPLCGLEKILFSFYTPTVNPQKISLLMNVYKVSEPSIENDKKQLYSLFFCSQEQLTDNYKKVCKAYSGLQHTFIDDIFNSAIGLKSERPIDIEETKFETSCVIPNWNPLKTINWISSRSVSAHSQLPDMMFYETVDGFNFKSINTLMQQEVKENYIYRIYGHNDLNNPDRYNYPNLSADHINIMSLAIKSRKDIISLVQGGTFAQKLVSFDVITGEYNTTTLNYLKEYDKINYHLSNGKLIPNSPTLDDVRLNEESNSYLTIVPNHTNLFGLGNPDVKRYAEWLPGRQSLFQQYNSTILQIVVPGDTARRVGDVVEVFIPSFEAFEEDQYVPDKYLSGKYMISSIRHHLKKDDHKMIIEIFKDGLNEPMPDEMQKD